MLRTDTVPKTMVVFLSAIWLATMLAAVPACRTTQTNQTEAKQVSGQGARANINSTILLFGDSDWRKSGGRCRMLVDEALSSKNYNDTLNFVPTQFGIVGAGGKIKLCHSGFNGTTCPAMDAKAIAEFKEGMSDCFAYVVQKGRALYGKPQNISILPHVDDGTGAGAWRNNMVFDPTPTGTDCSQNIESSYYCTMLKPLAEAVGTTVEPGGKVFFSLQGEMGATVFSYPKSYSSLLPAVRKLVTAGLKVSDQDLLVGLSLNYTRAVGDYFAGNRQDIAALFDHPQLGFVGVSSYGEMSFKPYALEYDTTMDTFAGELSFVGVSLAKIQQRGVQLHFSETALGGGNILGQAVSTSWLTSSSPWAGVSGQYSAATSPWTKPDLPALQEDFYCAQMRYLSGELPTRWKIQHSFIWNGGSWDVQGIDPGSRSAEGSSRNDKVGDWLVAYNKTGQLTCPSQQPLPRLADNVFDDFSGYGNDVDRVKRIYQTYPKAMGIQGVDLVAADSGKALRLTYKIGTGEWDHRAGIWLHGPFKWKSLQKQGLRVTLKPQAGVNLAGKKLIFGLRERSGEYWEAAQPLNGAQNGALSFSFASLKAPELVDNGSGDRILDLDDVFSFYLLLSDDQTTGQVETLDLHRLEFY